MAVRTGTSAVFLEAFMSEVKAAVPEKQVAARRVDFIGAFLMANAGVKAF